MMSDKEYKKWLETAWSDPTVVAEKRKDGFINYKINVCKLWGQMTLDDVSKMKMWAMDGLPVRLSELGVAPSQWVVAQNDVLAAAEIQTRNVRAQFPAACDYHMYP